MKPAIFQSQFERVLKRVLRQKMGEMRRRSTDGRIREGVKYAETITLAGGKRLRPYLAYLAYRAAGGRGGRVLEPLVGLELFHAFALVHDDIMDRGRTRHGVPTAHERFGDAQAILIGDLLFNWASEILAPTSAQPIFAKMVDEVILGQMLDVDVIRRDHVTDRFIQDKMRLKTAGYSFIRPMQAGVALTQNEKRKMKNMMKFCEDFGLALGLAFQIQDDLLDLTASSSKLGKSAMNDVKEGQKTVFTQHASKNQKNRALLKRMKGKKMTASDRACVKKMFEESGAIAYGTKKMDGYFDEAERVLERVNLPKQSKVLFSELIKYIRGRVM